MFLVGAFLTGGAVGYAASTFGTRASPPQFTTAQMRAEIKNQLKLSPEQGEMLEASYNARRAAFDSIRAIRQPAIDSIRAISMPAIDSIRVGNHQKVMQFLDATQKVRYQQMIDADKKKADSVKKAGGAK